jgi:hypothetical protein
MKQLSVRASRSHKGMGKCRYCDRYTGLFRKAHRDCRASFHMAFNEIVYVTQQSILDREVPWVTEARLLRIASGGRIPVKKIRPALVKGWTAALGHFFRNRSLSEDAEATLVMFKEYFALTPEELDAQGVHTRFGKVAPKEEASHRKLSPMI